MRARHFLGRIITKTAFSLISLLFLNTCAPVQYRIGYQTPRSLNFSDGKWLVNTIETGLTNKQREALTNNLINGLKKAGADSLYFVEDIILDYINPEKLSFDMSEETLKVLKETTDFDYLVNTRTLQITDDLDMLMLEPPFQYQRSRSAVSIAIYDMQRGLKIYHQQIIATTEMDEDDENIKFAKSADMLIFKALAKGLKEMKKYSVNQSY